MKDYRTVETSAWAAGAQLRHFHPNARIIAIRLRYRDTSIPHDQS